MKFSVIVPCYNCEATLVETLDSVISQNYDSFEIILINDGSSDNTDSVIKKYIATHNSDIKYIKQENKGVSYTRNVGIESASGEYILFLDSDDIIAPGLLDTISKLYDEHEPDVVYCRKIYGTENVLPVEKDTVKTVTASGENMILDMMCRMGTFSFCCFVYNNEVLKKEEELRFTEGARYGEDWEFALKYLSYCKRGIFMDAAGFYIRILQTSVSRTIIYEQTHVIGTAKRTLEHLKKLNHPMFPVCNEYLHPKVIFSVAHRFAASGREDLLGRLKNEYDVTGNMKQLLKNKRIDWKTKAMALLYLIHSKLFSLGCRILG